VKAILAEGKVPKGYWGTYIQPRVFCTLIWAYRNLAGTAPTGRRELEYRTGNGLDGAD
jgi:hypothetical protein